MIKKIIKIGILGLLTVELCACTVISPVIRDRGEDYEKANQTSQLKLPKSLKHGEKSHKYDIPPVKHKSAGKVTTMPPGFGNVPW